VEHLLALLASLLALNGNQVMDLDYQTLQLGRPSYPEIAEARAVQSFKNTNQIQNYAICCAILNWDAVKFLSKNPKNADISRIFAAEYSSAPSSEVQLKFLREYARQWQTNWEASPVEEGVLKRLSIQDMDEARVFADKLLANPKNLAYTQWYHWFLLVSERRKEEAQQFATENHIDKSLAASSRYPLPAFETMKVQIVWPRLARTDTYSYALGQKIWTPSVTPAPNKPIYIPDDWKSPQGVRYNRSWQKGPAWQVVYSREGNYVVRTAKYVEQNSHIEGKIRGNNISEEVVQELQEPAGYYHVNPTFVVVKR
jgi:hypothetical protein